jgi:hypothetical protein
MQKLTLVVAGVLVGAALTGCAAAAPPASPAGATPTQIVSTQCTRCHAVDRIKAASHDAAGWQATVTRMRGKGAALTDAQAQQVIDFLAGGGAAGL